MLLSKAVVTGYAGPRGYVELKIVQRWCQALAPVVGKPDRCRHNITVGESNEHEISWCPPLL